MRNCLLLHHDFLELFRLLAPEEAGKLIMAVMEYDINGEYPDFSQEPLLHACFIQIRIFLDRNSIRYNEICEKRSEAARRKWEKLKEKNVEN